MKFMGCQRAIISTARRLATATAADVEVVVAANTLLKKWFT